MPVRVSFERLPGGHVLPQWTPATAPPATPAPADPPELTVPLTPTLIIAAALATRDFNPVHHDPGLARAQGNRDIFLNILTTMGLVQRYVTDWAGPRARIRSISVRLGVPAYAGDTLTMTGRVTERTATPAGHPVDEREGEDDAEKSEKPAVEEAEELTVEVRGAVALGDHVTATVRLTRPTILPENSPAPGNAPASPPAPGSAPADPAGPGDRPAGAPGDPPDGTRDADGSVP
jgi:acyl dehydratase